MFKGYYDEGVGNRVVRRDVAIKRIFLSSGECGDNMKLLIEREIVIYKYLNEWSMWVMYILGSKFDVDCGDGVIYIVMELCGEFLATWLKNVGIVGGVLVILYVECMDVVW